MTINLKQEQINQILDGYEESVGLPKRTKFTEDKEIQHYLNMKRNEIEKLSPEDCAQISYRLAQYSFYLQREFNREQARTVWADNELKLIVMPQISQYGQYTKFEVAYHSVIKENEAAQNLYKIKTIAIQRVARLTYLASSLKHLSDIMLANQRAKREKI